MTEFLVKFIFSCFGILAILFVCAVLLSLSDRNKRHIRDELNDREDSR
jgi:hypothetical protein